MIGLKGGSKPQVKKKYYTRLMDISRRYPTYFRVFNQLIHFIFSVKAGFDLRIIKKKYIYRDAEINKWYQSHTLFFGFAVFRSGTAFLSNLLNSNLKDAIVQHEPNVNDYFYYPDALQNEAQADDYIKQYRLKEIYHRIHPFPMSIYGEINPFLRRHCVALKKFCPYAKQFHLVRNGKDVLRSLMSRELFDVNDPMARFIIPPRGDVFSENWKNLSRFEKLCWLWKTDNEFLRATIPHLVQFEKIISDYDYFKTMVTDFLETDAISYDVWKKALKEPTNRAPYRFPSFDDWSEEKKKIFERICGLEMSLLGY